MSLGDLGFGFRGLGFCLGGVGFRALSFGGLGFWVFGLGFWGVGSSFFKTHSPKPLFLNPTTKPDIESAHKLQSTSQDSRA